MTRDTEDGETLEIRSIETEIEVKNENANPAGDADKPAKADVAGSPADNYSFHNRLLKARIRK